MINNNIKVAIIYNDYFSGIDPNTGEKIRINPADLSEACYDQSIRIIEEALKNKNFKVVLFGVQSNLKDLMEFLQSENPDVIFNLCESFNHEAINEMYIAGLYELLKLNYTGNTSFTLGLLIQKVIVKNLLKLKGYNTPEFRLFNNVNEIILDDRIKFPLIVKPSREDASVGISNKSIVHNLEELKDQALSLFNYLKQPIFVEEYIEGREFNIAIIGDEQPEVLPISEIDFSSLPNDLPKIVTYAAKWMEGSPEYLGTKGVCPAVLNNELEKELKEEALKIFKFLNCRDYVRVDMRLSKDNVPYILEVNPNPDLSNDAGFFRSAKTSGMTYEDMIERITMLAYKRKEKIK